MTTVNDCLPEGSTLKPENTGTPEPETIPESAPETIQEILQPVAAEINSVSDETAPLPQSDGTSPTTVPVSEEASGFSAETPEELQQEEIKVREDIRMKNDAVTAYTASLWKYQPIPAEEPEPFPEYLTKTENYPGSRVIAARVRGKKHKHEGTNCDDWFETGCFGKITFAVVSDGAGSKKFSRIGAKESCRAAVGYLLHTFEELSASSPELFAALKADLSASECMNAYRTLAETVQQAAMKAYNAVESAFYVRKTDKSYENILGRGLRLQDLAGTLLIAVVIPLSDCTKEHLTITCQIGDGMICLLNTEGAFENVQKLMGEPDSGEYSGETDFLTSPKVRTAEALQNRTRISRGIADTVFLMSDGVADDYFPNETEMRRLYCDLTVNGILEKMPAGFSSADFTPEQLRLFRRIPAPTAYPWVNDPSVLVPLHYTGRICEGMGENLERIWKEPSILALARLELEDRWETADPAERLRIWLDNYTERGSFDDRTLVILTM